MGGRGFAAFFDGPDTYKAQRESLDHTPSSIYSWFLKPLLVLHSRFLTEKLWVVDYFRPPKNFSQFLFYFLFFLIKQLFSADATIVFVKKSFLPMKNHSLKFAHYSELIFFSPLLPWAAYMAENWKSLSEIGLRHPLLYLLCGPGYSADRTLNWLSTYLPTYLSF